jgi:hypothetical protein
MYIPIITAAAMRPETSAMVNISVKNSAPFLSRVACSQMKCGVERSKCNLSLDEHQKRPSANTGRWIQGEAVSVRERLLESGDFQTCGVIKTALLKLYASRIAGLVSAPPNVVHGVIGSWRLWRDSLMKCRQAI